MGLLPSEIYILFCFMFLFINLSNKNNWSFKQYKADLILIGLMVLIYFSFFLSLEINVLFKSILSWVMIITAFSLTRVTIIRAQDISLFLSIIIISAFYCSLISISSFINGINLSDFIDPYLNKKSTWDQNEYSYFLRATFFYANIAYVVGPAVVISFIKILKHNKLIVKFIYSIVLLFLLLMLFLMNEKTGLGSIIATLLIIFVYDKSYKGFRVRGRTVFPIVILFGTFLIYFYTSSISNYSIGISSFYQRLCVFKSTLAVLINNPINLMFGFGPDSSNLLNNNLIQLAKSSCHGAIEGAIDSGYLTYLFEYGILFFIGFLSFIIIILSKAYKLLKLSLPLREVLTQYVGILLYISIAATTDVIGTSKVTWIIAQNFAIIGLVLSKYNKVGISAVLSG